MLERLRQLLGAGEGGGPPPRGHSFEERQLAAAALLVEAASMDSDFDAGERAKIADLLRGRFALSAAEADDLLVEAERASDQSVEWQGFTSAVKDGFAPEERIQVIEMLWEVVYADGELHDYEASLLRRITGLLYVSDRESGEARKRVLARLGLAG
jgi:uncharacterized tellurite resistance protein B-like protein